MKLDLNTNSPQAAVLNVKMPMMTSIITCSLLIPHRGVLNYLHKNSFILKNITCILSIYVNE